MACNYLNAYKDSENCKINMAGTGDRVYFFDKDAWLAKINAAAASDEETTIKTVGFPEPGYKGFYGVDETGAADAEAIAKLNLIGTADVKLVGVDIKTDSGQVTSEKTAENEASSQVGTFVVVDNIENWNELAHTLAFMDYGCIIPRVGGGYYIIMSPWKKPTLESNYDSGTTYDSDHGFTATVTCAPSEYGVTFLPESTVIAKGEGSGAAAETTTATLNIA